MKLTAILLTAGFLNVCAAGMSQNVNFSGQNVSLESVFTSLEKQTGFVFIYTDRVLRSSKPVAINAENLPLTQFLFEVFKSQPLQYDIRGKSIFISRKPSAVSSSWRQLNAIGVNFFQDTLIDVKGRVVDEKREPVAGVSITLKGTATGITTNGSGSYSINVPHNGVLIFSHVGFITKETPVNGRLSIDVTLEEKPSELEQVVAIGYGTQKKSDLTGSILRIDMTKKAPGSDMNLLESIKGSAPGLNVSGGGARAGDAPSFSIRGKTSLSANDEPLIVLDGIIYNGALSDININDVESIDVLKDASAAAVYGSRSANGVMIINTKKGNTTKPHLSLNVSNGTQSFAKILPVMNAQQYAVRLVDYYWEQQLYNWYKTNPANDIGRPVRPDITDRNAVAYTLRSQEEKDNYLNGDHDINWVDLVTRRGRMQNYDLSASAKSDRSNYFISGSYTDQNGALLNDQFKRATVRANVESKMNDWLTIGLNSAYSKLDYSGVEASLPSAITASPLANKLTPSGSYPMLLNEEVYQAHPLRTLLIDNYDVRNDLFVLGVVKIKVPKIKGLTYDFNYSNMFYTSRSNTFYPPTINEGAANNGLAYKNESEERSWIINNILAYSRTFAADHRINATLLYSRENRTEQYSNLSAKGFGNSVLGYNAIQLATTPSIRSGAWEENSLSYMARANYVYKNRYMITGTIRKDGFSGFGDSKKYATFPSLSIAWVASEEALMRNTANWIDLIKFRVSYGLNGNQGIGHYSSLSKMSSNAYVYGPSTAIGIYPSSMGNIDLGWESTSSLNFGLDYAVLDQRLSGSIDVYTAKTNNVLVNRAIPAITGYDNVWTNIGEIANKGIELALTSVNIQGGDLSWETKLALSLNRDKITKLYGGGQDKDIGNSWFVGEPISAIYDYKKAGGVWTEQELYEGKITSKDFYPGHWRVVDLNKDGIIDANNDRSVIGYADPNYRFGITNALSYKNFTLSIFINGIIGGNNYYLGNNTQLLQPNNLTDVVQRTNQYNIRPYWTPDNKVDNSPGIFYSPPINIGLYEDRSFVRLQDVSLSYNFGEKFLRAKITDCNIFLSGKNLYTWTKWSGWDPENASAPSIFSSATNVGIMKTLALGIRLGF
ncbi:MAG: TonB-dependent receptor [Chitinophagaceae bacterium]|nr:TonB-dependent receptor [Chitinophagaceae bacterium]